MPLTGRSSRTRPAPEPVPGGIGRAAPPERRWMMAALGVVILAAVAIAVLLLRPAGPTDTPLVVAPPAAPPATPAAAPPAPAGLPAPVADSTPSQPRVSPPPRSDTRIRTGPPSPAPLPPPPSVVTPAPAPAPSPSPAPAPAPPPPAPVPVPPPPPPPPPAAVTVDDRAGVTAAIQAYARALDQGDLVQVRRLFPGISVEQRQGLEAFWKAGGTLRTRWTVSDIVITGETATARVEGTNDVTAPRERPSAQRVSWRARLERQGAEWRIISLAN